MNNQSISGWKIAGTIAVIIAIVCAIFSVYTQDAGEVVVLRNMGVTSLATPRTQGSTSRHRGRRPSATTFATIS